MFDSIVAAVREVLVRLCPAIGRGLGRKDEAKALCEKAASLIQAEGVGTAAARFQDVNGGFLDRDLYVFVLDREGVFVAHGARPALIGLGGLDIKDATGFPLFQAFMNVKDVGWVDYRWPHLTKKDKIRDKSSYILKVGEFTVGVGYYKN